MLVPLTNGGERGVDEKTWKKWEDQEFYSDSGYFMILRIIVNCM